jgi:hypothetical protein
MEMTTCPHSQTDIAWLQSFEVMEALSKVVVQLLGDYSASFMHIVVVPLLECYIGQFSAQLQGLLLCSFADSPQHLLSVSVQIF